MSNRILKIYHKGLEARALRLGQFILWQPSSFAPISATGGVITEFTDSEGVTWRVHTAITTTTFTVTDTGSDGRIERFLLGAGGGAYSSSGGGGGCAGGGAGELIPGIGLPVPVAANLYQLIVGVGGSNASGQIQARGGDTEAFGLVARGGGRGVSLEEEGDRDGGCGAGGGCRSSQSSASYPLAAPPGASIANNGLGNPGNAAWGNGNDFITGGGGGTGSPGVQPGYGGGGTLVNFDGVDRHYGGGGAGQAKDGSIFPGGIGGGGDSRQDGVDGLGGGGGGFAPDTGQGGKGGNGRIMVRYPINKLPSYWQ